GTLAAIDLSRVRGALRATPPDLGLAQTQLAALLNLLAPGSVAMPTPTPEPTSLPGTVEPTPPPTVVAYVPQAGTTPAAPLESDEAGRRLNSVLADPRFRPPAGGGIQDGLASILAPVVGFLVGLPDLQ